ncbi:MAG: tRNA (adenosine(37)-N6)-dimethylallyltransferase MiaA [Gammaproteobacteria bacterium]|nr:tRNA (adenosine(37)-N6)-dimethylallyltransferase MiaA [Gammaproteobacteria bacterium]MBU1628596.1 tRNA (adenosine(37)-N6)-dimethylallyltransferase MiaA [Gammaproteobacteria bacterium]MBU1927273.1 tRNA (adenosine(37)-N6)-dimethylallyltransferase MiaA [Gammaproteobacteria bacterium]MBU2545648.1 tRNA (adenosine(37)-N6)-dimethylallyltransferase MiaA [Gammaproteobacteria bacterium]
MGPTASGKSDLAIQIAQWTVEICPFRHPRTLYRHPRESGDPEKSINDVSSIDQKTELQKSPERFPCEIVSVDSALIYRHMDIGTAKPDKTMQAAIPHHLIDIRNPNETYSAAEFRKDALAAIHSIETKQEVPLLVGGTMLYFKALLYGLSPLPTANPAVREHLQKIAESKGLDYLHEQLLQVDPETAKRVHPNDPQRIQRALEVYEITGKPMSQLCKVQEKDPFPYHAIQIALMPPDRKILHQRIKIRFEHMLKEGLIDEVKALMQRFDLHADLPSMRSVGYRQVLEYLNGKIDFETMKEKAIAATRQLAKRQLTWLRSWPDVHWFKPEDLQGIKKFCQEKIS